MKRTLLLAALLASPLAFAAGAGPGTGFPDDPHNPAPAPGVESTQNPIEKPMPRTTDAELPGTDPRRVDEDQRLPAGNQRLPGNPATDQSLPGMGEPKPATAPATTTQP
ncbi:hypothetical protein [Pseudomonas sp.]|uniref:hypothetical protein n=1 Tax=Pseudomonas sp. TaxID=306 RepID=UPI0028ABBC5A|nr:hypothetical protein [Pseudomonas sp.]